MNSIETKIISSDLLSGSSDAFRTLNGGNWTSVASDEGTVLKFDSLSSENLRYPPFNKVFSDVVSGSITLNESVLNPNKVFAVRVTGDDERVRNDDDWKAIWLGGTYGKKTYTPVYNEVILRNMNLSISMPYSKIEETKLTSDYATDVIEIGYSYQQYSPFYQDTVAQYTSELQIPSYTIMKDLSRWEKQEDISAIYPEELINYISRENTYPAINELFVFNAKNLPEDIPKAEQETNQTLISKNTNLSVDYLQSAVFSAPLSSSTISWTEDKLRNVLFDHNANTNLNNLGVQESKLPYYVKISFPGKPKGEIGQEIENNKFSSKLIKLLYKSFSGEIEGLTPQQSSFVLNKEYYTGSLSDGISKASEATTTTLREIDYISMLTYAYRNFESNDIGCLFVGGSDPYRASANESGGIYRHINTIVSSKTLKGGLDFLKNPANIDINDFSDLYSDTERHTEVIAYRVEKIGGAGSGDANTQNTLQNYWFINSDLKETFEFIDNQIKYNTDYTYNVYYYVLSFGIEYQYSNLLLSRDLGFTNSSDQYAVEMYTPSTDEATDELYDSDNNDSFDKQAGGGYGTNAQIYSDFKYVADFNLSYQPVMKIIEIPVYSKTLRVLEHPGNELDVVPFQNINQSQKLGFDFTYGVFNNRHFPSTISNDDNTYKQNYLNANDILETSIIRKQSISKPRYIEIYRLEDRPMAITDFDQNLIATLDLKIENQDATYTKDFFEDTVKTNKKYYYLFRVLNEQRVLSHTTDIYEAELINDGGYYFAVYNIIFESELDQKIFNNPSKEFKKLFQLQPNLSQVALDTTNIDFSDEAQNQKANLIIGTADDLIWDKTFKIRLTSKKTGRKIDLNITYRLNS